MYHPRFITRCPHSSIWFHHPLPHTVIYLIDEWMMTLMQLPSPGSQWSIRVLQNESVTLLGSSFTTESMQLFLLAKAVSLEFMISRLRLLDTHDAILLYLLWSFFVIPRLLYLLLLTHDPLVEEERYDCDLPPPKYFGSENPKCMFWRLSSATACLIAMATKKSEAWLNIP